MRVGINAGFGDPIQHELVGLQRLGIAVVRQDLWGHPTDPPIESLIAEFANQSIVPLFVLAGDRMQADRRQRADDSARVEPDVLAGRAKRLVTAATATGLQSYMIEIGNEPDIAITNYSAHPEEYAEAVLQTHLAVRAQGFTGAVMTAGISNLNRRGLEYLRRTLQTGRIPADVWVAFHRYPVSAHGPEQAQEGFNSREAEWQALKSLTGDRPVACTEFGYHTAPDSFLKVLHRQRTDEEAADGLLWDLGFFGQHDVQLAAIYQLNDGPDPNLHLDRYGIRRQDGTLKPQASVIQRFADGSRAV